jgi:hypothetical protein
MSEPVFFEASVQPDLPAQYLLSVSSEPGCSIGILDRANNLFASLTHLELAADIESYLMSRTLPPNSYNRHRQAFDRGQELLRGTYLKTARNTFYAALGKNTHGVTGKKEEFVLFCEKYGGVNNSARASYRRTMAAIVLMSSDPEAD